MSVSLLKTHLLIVFVSLATALGVVLHDTKIDRAAVTVMGYYGSSGADHVVKSGDSHTHVEKASFSNLTNTSVARTQARQHDEKKYLSDRLLGRGHYAFDNYNFPLPA